MEKPSNNDILGDVYSHRCGAENGKYLTKFSLLPNVEFITWVKKIDDNLNSWWAKPENTENFVFLITEYREGYISFTNVKLFPDVIDE